MLQNELQIQAITGDSLKKEFSIDTEFKSIQDFIESFSKSAATKQVSFKIKRRNTKGISLGCKDVACTFTVNAYFSMKRNICIVSKAEPYHTCVSNPTKLHSNTLIKEVIRENEVLGVKPKDVLRAVRQKCSLEINYSTAYKALKSFKSKEKIILKESYGYLTSLISTMNPLHSVTDLETQDNRFKRFFMVCEVTKIFWSHSRKIITVDGTFLAGPIKGTLLVAVAQDGKEQLVLLADAIVKSENLDSWRYFLEQLNSHFQINNTSTILMSDRDTGLLSAVNIVLPNIIRCSCVRHLAKNLRNGFRNRVLIDKFWTMAYTYDESQFEIVLEEARLINQNFYEAIVSSNVSSWANSKCLIERYGKNTSNSAESMNAALKKFVTKDICNLIVSINNYMMEIFNKRRNITFSTPVFPEKLLELETNILLSRSLTVSLSNNSIYLVANEYIINYTEKM